MLGVEDVYALRRKVLVEGKSQRQVAREMGLARDTVRRYLATPLPEPRRRKRSRPVLEQVRPRLEQLTEEWSERTTAKQRITGRRLHRALREEGYDVGVSLVLEYLREWRRKRAEVYVPLVHRPGDEAQVDFFEVVVELAGVRSKAWLFLMRLMHSGRDFVRLYERQDQLSFLDGHVRAFAHVGGVPRRTVYDNLSAAVRRVQFPRRALTDRFQALVSHYCVEPCFARPGEGHDKGGVESRGRGVRLQVLTPIPRGDSLQELSEEMQGEVDRLAPQQVWERFAVEEPLLRSLPEVAFEARRMQPVSVSRSALVRLEGAWYSVPERWAGLPITAWVGVAEVTLCLADEQVSHPRQRFGGRRVSYRHYLGELSRERQRRFRERRTAFADQGRRFVELVGRAPADEIELRVAEVAERESITFSEALDRVLRDDPTAYREPDSDDDTHETAFREGIAAIDDAWLERAESLREDGEPLDDALRRAFHEWDEDDPGAATIRAAQKVTGERLEAAEPTKAERTAEVEDELLALAEKRRQSGQSLRDAIDAVVASPEGVALMQRVKKARGSA